MSEADTVGVDGAGAALAAAARLQQLGDELVAELPGLLADVHAAEKWGAPDDYTTPYRSGPNGYDSARQRLASALLGGHGGQGLGQRLTGLGDAAMTIILSIQAQDVRNAAQVARSRDV